MSKFGFVGPSYTAKSNTVADEECINFFAETNETPGAQAQRSYFGTPGLKLFAELPDSPTRGGCKAGDRVFQFASDFFYEVFEDGTFTARSPELIVVFGEPVSMAVSNTQIMLAAGGRGYCFTLADNSWLDVTDQLAGFPTKVSYSDGYFIFCFRDSNKFQMSDILDGTVWPGLQVNAVSVFPENIASIIVSHRELWVLGLYHVQPYQNTGTDEIFDVIPGALIEMGCAAPFGVDRVDNTVFWVSQDERGARQCWRANGYTPQRLSTHAVETWLDAVPQADFPSLTTYSYQDGGHLFWVLYVPNSDATWVYDVAEGLWHKRAEWKDDFGTWEPHRTWNHIYAWGKHLVGDWKTGNLYEMSMDALDDQIGPIQPAQIPPVATPDPPRPTVSGEGIMWAFATATHAGSETGGGTGGSAVSDLYSGYFTQHADRPLGEHVWGANWYDFALPPELPVGATITGIYAVMKAVSTGSGTGVYGRVGVGVDIFTNPTGGGESILPTGPFTEQVFYSSDLGAIDVSTLTIGACLYTTLSFDGFMDLTAEFVGFAIYYTPEVEPSGAKVNIRRLRRSPTLNNELNWVYFSELTVDFATGLGPQPPLQDGDGNPRPPQAMLRWSNDGGSTWSNQHIENCGFAGQYNTRVVWRRLGRGRRRVFEVSVSDPIPWSITDAYLKANG